jgi:hypothetical protein
VLDIGSVPTRSPWAGAPSEGSAAAADQTSDRDELAVIERGRRRLG